MKINIRTAVINVITALILALLLEGLVSLGLSFPSLIPGFLQKTLQAVYMETDRNIVQYDCGQYDPKLFYRLKPGECTFTNTEFSVLNQINSKGLRDDERSLKAPEIIVLGDSYTMGWGVKQGESFPEVLERSAKVSVLNAGISSYGTARQMLLLEELDRDSTKLLIIQYASNDHPENIEYLNNDYTLPVREAWLFDYIRTEAAKDKRYYLFKYTASFARNTAKNIKQHIKRMLPPPDKSPDELGQAEAFMRIINHHVRPVQNLRVLVFTIDDYYSYSNQFIQDLDTLLKQEEYKHLRVATVRLEQLSQEDYFILDDHLTASGHEKVSRKLNQAIQNLRE